MIAAIGDFESIGFTGNIFSPQGEDVFLLPAGLNPALPGALGRHADLQHCFIRRTATLYSAKGCKAPLLPFPGIRRVTGSLIPHPPYPHDTVCNIAVCGDYAIGNSACTDPVLVEEIGAAGLEWIDVRQGYSGCSCIAFDTKAGAALITSDPGIARACADKIDTLLLPPQETIRLPGYRQGFIGGIGGLCSVAYYVAGNLDKLACGGQIREFMASYGIEAIGLSDEVPLDIGGLIFLEF